MMANKLSVKSSAGKEKSDEGRKEVKKTTAEKKISPAALKDRAFETIFDSIDLDSVVKVEALAKGYHSPEKMSFGGYNAKFHQPDAVAFYDEHADIYSIEVESSKKAISKNLGKWILFSLEAKKSKGEFYIVTSKSHLKDITGIIESKQIHAEIVALDAVPA